MSIEQTGEQTSIHLFNLLKIYHQFEFLANKMNEYWIKFKFEQKSINGIAIN